MNSPCSINKRYGVVWFKPHMSTGREPPVHNVCSVGWSGFAFAPGMLLISVETSLTCTELQPHSICKAASKQWSCHFSGKGDSGQRDKAGGKCYDEKAGLQKWRVVGKAEQAPRSHMF